MLLMNRTYESNFEAVIHHYLQIKLNRVNVDDCFFKILILVANYRVESEKRGVTLTKIQAFRALIAQHKTTLLCRAINGHL